MRESKEALAQDWRYTGQDKYLDNVALKYKHFYTAIREHDHCEFCFAKFSDNQDDLHDGYCTLDGYHWICDNCYNDFKKIFNWKIVK